MQWIPHTFSNLFQLYCDVLIHEPVMPRPQVRPLGAGEIKIDRIEIDDIKVITEPWHPIRSQTGDGGLVVKHLASFAGDVILRNDFAEWRIPYRYNDGKIGSPRPTLRRSSDRIRLDGLREFWLTAMSLEDTPQAASYFERFPTGCTRILIFHKLGCKISSPLKSAKELDNGSFVACLGSVWPAILDWILALGFDGNGSPGDEFTTALEHGLLRWPPPELL